MESKGALAPFKWSQKKLGLTYMTYTGNGDSKLYATVLKATPYRPLVHIVKKECVLYITKQMGTVLREIVKWWKGNFNI